MRTRIRIAFGAVIAALLATALMGAATAAAQETDTTTTEPTTTETEPTETTPAPTTSTTTDRYRVERRRILSKIRALRRETWRWQHLMRVPLTRPTQAAERSESLAFQRWVLRSWRQKAGKMRWRAHHPRRLEAWLCIHRHEGPWNANTGNGYYGGLQMDVQFQRTYGADLVRRKGLAHRWGYLEQIWVAERAYRSGRGFYPWPNTARYCGLI
jgi:transglycosylase-like protein